jgi:hypothetical protein
MSPCGRAGFWARMQRLIGLRREPRSLCGDWNEEPPDAFVREPRRPRPFGPAGVMTLELPGSG